MSEFVTVLRNSAEGQRLLMGRDPENHYIPIRSQDAGHSQERVTFQILKRKEIQKPAPMKLLGELLKWRRLVFVLFPFLRWLVASTEGLDMGIFILSLLSSLSLFWGVSWQADFLDHLRGYEPVDSDKKILSQGWLSAYTLNRASSVMIILSFLFAISIFIVRPLLLVVGILLGILLLILFFSKGRAYKQRGFFDFGLVLITGPLFTASLQYALFEKVTVSEIIFGLTWGLLFLFAHSVQSFPKLVQLAQYRVEPWLYPKDFDKNRIFFPAFWLCILALYLVYEALNYRFLFATIDVAVLLFFTWRWIKTLQSLKSPLGSNMKKAGEEGHLLVLLFIFLWLIEIVFSEFVRSLSKLL